MSCEDRENTTINKSFFFVYVVFPFTGDVFAKRS